MKKFPKQTSKILLIPLLAVLTSCGYALREVYDGDAYNHPLFEANFYYGKADAFDPESPNYKVKSISNHDLDKNEDMVFCCSDTLNDDNFKALERGTFNNVFDFSDANYLSNIENSFKYGYASKLFDNWPECGGRYEKARIQIDNNQRKGGFNAKFNKECDNAPYTAFIFQNGVGKRDASGDERFKDILRCNCTIDLTIGFFIRTDEGKGEETYRLDNYKYQISGFYNNCSHYCFFGFSLENIEIARCQGISISYDVVSIIEEKKVGQTTEYIDHTAEYNSDQIGHCIYAYEMWFPHSSWN